MDPPGLFGSGMMRRLLLCAVLLASPAQGGVLEDCTQTGDWWLRINACTQAIESGRWPGASASWAYSNRAVAYAALGNPLSAFDDHNQAVKLDPANASARNNKANTHADFREYKRAIAEYSAAIRLRPDYANALFNRAGVYYAVGQNAEAAADYTSVIALVPEFGDAYAGRAEANCRLGKAAESVEDRLDAIRLETLTAEAVAGYLQEKGYLSAIPEPLTSEALTPPLTEWTGKGCP